MKSPLQLPFIEQDPALGPISLAPIVPVDLARDSRSVVLSGLLDTGAAVNVLPYDVGTQLGAVWDQQPTAVQLTGNLASLPAKGLVLSATVGTFAPVLLVFAWTRSNDVPVLFGQMNFFLEFDVCFFRSRAVFEVQPKQP